MELWIRSQDKETLTIPKALQIEANEKGYSIVSYIINSWCAYLGTYKTKKRALEVLDEIQKKLEEYCIIDTENVRLISNGKLLDIYEMPQE